MQNHLVNQTSPYLLQHVDNPVDWYPWGEEALKRAKAEDKPIFLSIGYSTCHWCHVMAHESFEDEQVAEILNQNFISIKVDKEERPDIDSVYMSVCQALTGSGGWPTTIFMTPDQKPFFAGTYFPKHTAYGSIGFMELITTICEKWKTNREALMHSSEDIFTFVLENQEEKEEKNNDFEINKENAQKLFQNAIQIYKRTFDEKNGGFGAAPKFPSAHNLLYLMHYFEYILRYTNIPSNNQNHTFYHNCKVQNFENFLYANEKKSQLIEEMDNTKRQDTYDELKKDAYRVNKEQQMLMKMVNTTLLQMYRGGIYDHIGGGFCRYSTDEKFFAPHFEKMLYDNAILLMAYCKAYEMTGNILYQGVAEKTATFIIKEMTSPRGGFYSAQDADSEGIEGKYYLFEPKEIKKLLGTKDGENFCKYFDITEEGNFEGKNIPNLLRSDHITAEYNVFLPMIYEYRKKRYHLHVDDKILTAWNGLMIAAMSMLYRITQKEEYLGVAEQAQRFLEDKLWEEDVVFASWRDGLHSEQGFLNDYANEIFALISLYQATFENIYLEKAEKLCRKVSKDFYDTKNGGFFLSGKQNEHLIFQPKETYDGAAPSGNSMMAYNLVSLYHLTGKSEYEELAKKQLLFLQKEAMHYPAGYAMFLIALMDYVEMPDKVVVVLKDRKDIKDLIYKISLDTIVQIVEPSENYPLVNEKTTYYVCKGRSCLPPTNEL